MKYENEGRILLIDDERLVRFTISSWLKASGYEVVAVGTAEEGVAELRKGGFETIVSDVMMEPMDGFMFRDLVRGFNPTIPFVFLTALINSSSNQLMARVVEDLYSCYVAKNAKRDFLLGRIRQQVNICRAQNEVKLLSADQARSLALSASVQHALLPPWTNFEHAIGYSYSWRPHDIVSGDLMAWFPLGEQAALCVFGDISGHGTPAALAMCAVLSHLKMFVSINDVDARKPHLICREIDRFVRDNLEDVAYMAGMVLYFNFETRQVLYCNAGGQEPLCFLRRDGSRLPLNAERHGCLPMGLMNGAAYEESDVVTVDNMPEDAVILLYSDGFVDLSSDRKGEDRVPDDMMGEIIAEILRGANGTSDVASLPYRLEATLSDMGYVNAQDDMTFAVIAPSMIHAGRFIKSIGMRNRAEIDAATEQAGDWARKNGVGEMQIAKLELLLSEHLENVRKHGIAEGRRRFEVVLMEARLLAGGVEMIVWDRGSRWEGDLTELAPHPDLKLDEQNETMAGSGRGMAILRKVCPRMTYESFGSLNKLTFQIGD